MADYDFLKLRREHALHCCLDLVYAVINDAVHAHIDLAARRAVACGIVRTNVEADDYCAGCGSEHNIGFIDRADGAVDDLDPDFLVGYFLKGSLDCLGRALNVGLDNNVERLHFTGLDLTEQILKADLLRAWHCVAAHLDTALLGKLSCHALICNGIERVARAGTSDIPEISTGWRDRPR